jgi:Flp pilus assembly protein TadD
MLASLAVDMGQFQEAQTVVDEILALSPDNPSALVLNAAVLQGLSKFPAARSGLIALQARFPNAEGLDVEIGFVSLHEKKFADAERVFRKRYQPGQENLRALVGLTQSLVAQKRGAEAVRILEADLAKIPNRPQVQFMLAEGYLASADSAKAMQVLEQVVAAHPDIALTYLRLADLQIRKGDVDRGIATLTKARDLAPKVIEPLLLLGSAQVQSQRFEEAKQNYRAVLKLDAGNLEALNNLAFLTADTGGNLEEALKLATEASHKAPTLPHIADTMGYVYLKMRKTENALQIFRSLARRYPVDVHCSSGH